MENEAQAASGLVNCISSCRPKDFFNIPKSIEKPATKALGFQPHPKPEMVIRATASSSNMKDRMYFIINVFHILLLKKVYE